jgi:tetratricopeptide (TPR) repeat protein
MVGPEMRRRPPPFLLLGGFAAAAAAAIVLGVWLLLPFRDGPPEAAEGPGRLVSDAAPPAPDQALCAELLLRDPEEAGRFALEWARRNGGEGAERCTALALIALGQPERGAARLEGLAARSGADAAARAGLYAEAVQGWMLAGDLPRAYAAATLGLSLAPADPGLLLDRAMAAGGLGRYAEALSDLDHVLSAEPRRAEAWAFRAAALRRMERGAEALAAADHALTLDPDHPEALLERGILRQAAGDPDGARTDWLRLIQVAPESAAADLASQNLVLLDAGPASR